MADELKRRLVHASGSGLVALWLLAQRFEWPLSWDRFQRLVGVLAIGAIVLEFFRLYVGLDWALYDTLTRAYEQEKVAGYGLYMIGMAFAVLLFEPDIALPAMLMLALGDPVSGALSDDRLRRVKRPRVLVATFVVCAAIAWPFLRESPLAVAAAALGATIADGVTLRLDGAVVDDNLTIPVFASIAAFAALAVGPL